MGAVPCAVRGMLPVLSEGFKEAGMSGEAPGGEVGQSPPLQRLVAWQENQSKVDGGLQACKEREGSELQGMLRNPSRAHFFFPNFIFPLQVLGGSI